MARRRSQLAGGVLSRRLRSFPERRSVEPGRDLPWDLTMADCEQRVRTAIGITPRPGQAHVPGPWVSRPARIGPRDASAIRQGWDCQVGDAASKIAIAVDQGGGACLRLRRQTRLPGRNCSMLHVRGKRGRNDDTT
jgi:hypothetical protein